MKTKLIKNFAILSIALMGMFVIGNNLKEVYAQSSDLSTIECPGGSCTYTFSHGETCSACCIRSDRPVCTVWGCECKERGRI